jgi:hypothetical protein
MLTAVQASVGGSTAQAVELVTTPGEGVGESATAHLVIVLLEHDISLKPC